MNVKVITLRELSIFFFTKNRLRIVKAALLTYLLGYYYPVEI